LNEKKLGVTPYQNDKIMPDKYTLKLEAKNHESLIADIQIEKNKSLDLNYKLKRNAKYKKKIQNIRRIAFGVLTAGFGGAGIYFNKEAKTASDNYDNYNGYDNEIHKKNWEEFEKNKTRRNVMYGLAGACTIGFGISLMF